MVAVDHDHETVWAPMYCLMAAISLPHYMPSHGRYTSVVYVGCVCVTHSVGQTYEEDLDGWRRVPLMNTRKRGSFVLVSMSRIPLYVVLLWLIHPHTTPTIHVHACHVQFDLRYKGIAPCAAPDLQPYLLAACWPGFSPSLITAAVEMLMVVCFIVQTC